MLVLFLVDTSFEFYTPHLIFWWYYRCLQTKSGTLVSIISQLKIQTLDFISVKTALRFLELVLHILMWKLFRLTCPQSRDVSCSSPDRFPSDAGTREPFPVSYSSITLYSHDTANHSPRIDASTMTATMSNLTQTPIASFQISFCSPFRFIFPSYFTLCGLCSSEDKV